ncbi:hypothetical protein RintRC_6111 [Richelia intracellularis]|nr:hypothetical protein RintRC_6111 [Richelia intracellularis]
MAFICCLILSGFLTLPNCCHQAGFCINTFPVAVCNINGHGNVSNSCTKALSSRLIGSFAFSVVVLSRLICCCNTNCRNLSVSNNPKNLPSPSTNPQSRCLAASFLVDEIKKLNCSKLQSDENVVMGSITSLPRLTISCCKSSSFLSKFFVSDSKWFVLFTLTNLGKMLTARTTPIGVRCWLKITIRSHWCS